MLPTSGNLSSTSSWPCILKAFMVLDSSKRPFQSDNTNAHRQSSNMVTTRSSRTFYFPSETNIVLGSVKSSVVRLHWLKSSGHMEGICPASYLFFTCEQTSQLLKVIMLMRTVMVLLRSFQSRNQQVVQLSMADPGVGRSKVVFEVWSQDATEKLSPTPSEPVFFPGDGE